MQMELSNCGISEWSKKGTFRLIIRTQLDVGPYSANDISFDKSSNTLAVACDDSSIRLIKDDENETKEDSVLKGHTDTVQGVVFDYNSRTLISCSSDSEFKIWS
jgi:WD40 repeat protein